MKPGKALNEKIARDVMKWNQHDTYPHLWDPREHSASPFEPLPDFSTSMTAANRILKKFNAMAKEFQTVGDGTGKAIVELPGGRRVEGHGETHAHAICEAALKFWDPA